MKEILEKIDKMNTAPYSMSELNFCYARAINDVRKIILSEQSEQKEPCEEYIKWLENMTILLSVCYQQTRDMLLQKMKEGNKAFLEMPTVQGFEMCMMVDKISKLKPIGTIDSDKLEGFTNWLMEQYRPPTQPSTDTP